MNVPIAHDQIRPMLEAGWAALAHDARAAQRHAESALTAMPGSADGKLLLAAALRRQGQVMAARTALAPLMTPPPSAPVPWFEWGMVLAATGEHEDTVIALQQAVRLAPGFTAAWRAMGDALLVLGERPRAGQAYAHAARAANKDARLAPAAAALCENKAPAALAMLREHLLHHADEPAALHLLGEAELRSGTPHAAEAALLRCLEIAPDLAEARHSLAVLFYLQGKHGQAALCFADLVTRAPHNASLRVLLTSCLMKIGRFEDAIPHYEQLLAGYNAHAGAWLMYGHALKTVGRDTEALAAYRACIALAPDWSASAYLGLADVKTASFTEAEIAAMRTALPRLPPGLESAQLHYALARGLESQGDTAAAFTHFAAGARVRRSAIAYDADALSLFVRRSTEELTREFFAARRGSGCPSAAPILIVGMPRSGSTLVEQILASHSAVEGTGELETIGDIARELRGGRNLASLPETIARLPPSAFAQLGARYLDETAQYRRAGTPHFIDKMPDNFLHAGLIHLMLPNARIIDVRRGAMAAGWAAYKQFFQPKQTGQDYTYDLAEIGRYRRDYVALMAHWQAVLPGRVHLLAYERLVENTEAEIRALLEFCALPFEPACLRFWETARAVQTPSAQQVRQPIFRDGLDAWRDYAPWLGALRGALGEE